MAILIDNNMGRPNNCRQCEFTFRNPAVGGHNCIPEHRHIKDDEYGSKTRPEWCPLKRYMRRRLIDADELADTIQNIASDHGDDWNGWVHICEVLDAINKAETMVISADVES